MQGEEVFFLRGMGLGNGELEVEYCNSGAPCREAVIDQRRERGGAAMTQVPDCMRSHHCPSNNSRTAVIHFRTRLPRRA